MLTCGLRVGTDGTETTTFHAFCRPLCFSTHVRRLPTCRMLQPTGQSWQTHSSTGRLWLTPANGTCMRVMLLWAYVCINTLSVWQALLLCAWMWLIEPICLCQAGDAIKLL